MPCFHPLRAFRTASGDVVFQELARYDVVAQLSLPCGQCIGCRLERSRKWAMRCMHEASLYDANCFLTLTYSPDNLPHRGQLVYSDFQKFMKRLRKDCGFPVRFYMCGEYGSENGRPHFHALLFGLDFADKRHFKRLPSGDSLFVSDTLNRLWPFGFASIGNVTFESAAYVARYCVQKVTGWNARFAYSRLDADGVYQLVPEFNKMSLKPGIGARWLEKFSTDVFPRDYVVVNGVKSAVPKYYDKLLDRSNPDLLEEIKERRVADAKLRFEDNTDERLGVKEVVAKARNKMLIRSLI